MKNKKVVIEDVDKIKEYLDGKSNSILNLINNNKTCNYTLFQKYITHSDIITAGKRLGNQSVDKNYLYYLSNEKMLEIEKTQEMESAKQSNIGMPKEFYETLEIPFLERRKGQQTTHHTHYILNDFADVYLVNDSVEYFDIEFTKKVFEKLNKNVPWDFDKYKVKY